MSIAKQKVIMDQIPDIRGLLLPKGPFLFRGLAVLQERFHFGLFSLGVGVDFLPSQGDGNFLLRHALHLPLINRYAHL